MNRKLLYLLIVGMAFLLATPALVSALVVTSSALAYWYTYSGEVNEPVKDAEVTGDAQETEMKEILCNTLTAEEGACWIPEKAEAGWLNSRRGLKRRCSDSFIEGFQGVKGVHVELGNTYDLLQSSVLYDPEK